MKTDRQKKTLKEKKVLVRLNKMQKPQGESKYARKHRYLHGHGGFGFEYKEKPWK